MLYGATLSYSTPTCLLIPKWYMCLLIKASNNENGLGLF